MKISSSRHCVDAQGHGGHKLDSPPPSAQSLRTGSLPFVTGPAHVSSGNASPESLQATHARCFACGAAVHGLGLAFVTDANGVARTSWQPRQSFSGYPDRVHGGVISTLMDSAMVHALFARGVPGVTAELTVRFIQPANLDACIAIAGRVDSMKHGLYFCSAEALQNGQTIVLAGGKFFPMPDPFSLGPPRRTE